MYLLYDYVIVAAIVFIFSSVSVVLVVVGLLVFVFFCQLSVYLNVFCSFVCWPALMGFGLYW